MGEAKKIAKAATKAAETARRYQDMLDKRQTINSDDDIAALVAADLLLDGRLDTVETALPLKLEWTTVPASAAATGTAGQIAYATGFLYICVATDTWERAVIATWV
jgi:hypothetical protein